MKRFLFFALTIALLLTVTFVCTAAADPGSADDAEITTAEEQNSTREAKSGEIPLAANYIVTFDLGDQQVTVSVPENETIPASCIPAADASGSTVVRWYLPDLSAVVDPNDIVVTEDLTLTAWYAPALRDDHSAYMSGYGNGMFGPDDPLTRAEAAQILCNLLADPSQIGAFPCIYPDVSSGDWYYDAVTVTASLGLFDCSGSAFGPNEIITRGEFADLVTHLVPQVETENPFPDLEPSSPYYEAVLTAYAYGWIDGTDTGLFLENDPLTRSQAVKIFNGILNRSADSTIIASGKDLRTFTDVSVESWYYSYIMEAAIDHTAEYAGGTEIWKDYTHTCTVTFLVDGIASSRSIYPGEYLDRSAIPAQNASGTAIDRWTVTGSSAMEDPAAIPVKENISYSAWYAPSLSYDHDVYINGCGDGTFQPDQPLTRAEACQMLYGLLAEQSYGSYASFFSDVKSGSWYYDAVTTLASLDIIEAVSPTYGPDEVITRGEFSEMISKFAPLPQSESSFSDVDSLNPHYAAVSAVAEQGWLVGMGDGRFGVDEPLTRAEAVTVFNRMTNRYGDADAENDMDSRYTFSDVSACHWAFVDIMEAATCHTYSISGTKETWSGYSHADAGSVDWESSDSVVNAASILLSYSSDYAGDYSQNYNVDYSTKAKEDFVNSRGYSSSTSYLIWVSRACQKVYIFTGSKGSWALSQTFICGTGADATPTPVGVTYITGKQAVWNFSDGSTAAPVVQFYPNTGYAFHSRLYYLGSTTRLMDASIGYPVSHGCVRMLTPDVTYIYQNIPINTTVVIY